MNAATKYNNARASSLWFVEDLPPRIAGAGDPDSQAFADEVAAYQTERGIGADGMLGPRTWALMRAELGMEDPKREPQPLPVLSDVAVDSREEAELRIKVGMNTSAHLKQYAGDYCDVLQGRFSTEQALNIYRSMRHDGRKVAADIQRKGGEDAVRAYAYKGRTAAQMRRNYSKRWHKWLLNDHRSGMGIHWTAGTGSAKTAARYLLHTKPGRVSSNVFIDYDGSCFIVYPTYFDPEIGDTELLYTSHGAHNPGCFGVDFASPGFLERAGGRWRSKSGGRVRDEVIAACGVVTLEDIEHRTWNNAPTEACPWLLRKNRGRVWSVKHFLAPSWEQLAALCVLGRIHSKLYGWTKQDLVCVGHYQRSDSRADPFFYPLGWIRSACIGDGMDADLLKPGSFLARCNPSDVQQMTIEYREWARPFGW